MSQFTEDEKADAFASAFDALCSMIGFCSSSNIRKHCSQEELTLLHSRIIQYTLIRDSLQKGESRVEKCREISDKYAPLIKAQKITLSFIRYDEIPAISEAKLYSKYSN